MPGVTEAIAQFLSLLNKSGLAERFKDAYDKRTADDKKLKDNVAAMKDAPPPNTGEPNG
jgi:hypothetical protein